LEVVWYGGFEALSRVYCRHTDVCVLVYDITNPSSLEQLTQLKSIYEGHRDTMGDVGDHTVYAVFANKVPTHHRHHLLVPYELAGEGGGARSVR
jgi:GTPase SAR1 family protein